MQLTNWLRRLGNHYYIVSLNESKKNINILLTFSYIYNHIFASFKRHIQHMKLLFISVKVNPSKIGGFTLLSESFVS